MCADRLGSMSSRKNNTVGSVRAANGGGFDLVLAADVLYSVGDIRPLVRAACALMTSDDL